MFGNNKKPRFGDYADYEWTKEDNDTVTLRYSVHIGHAGMDCGFANFINSLTAGEEDIYTNREGTNYKVKLVKIYKIR